MKSDLDYADYPEWKGWTELFVCGSAQSDYFCAEFRGIELHSARLLEIGFGSGAFAIWARGRGADVVLSERNPALRGAAIARGFEMLELDDPGPMFDGSFDLIVALDVLEHMEIGEVEYALRIARRLLAPTGRLLARFPNGQSPLGSVKQHGDSTHRSVLSAPIIEQLAGRVGLRLTAARGAAQPLPRGFARVAGNAARASARRLVGALLRAIYGVVAVWDPVVVVELEIHECE